jgi:zeta-carotene desaturase
MTHVVVIGGGLAGLATAAALGGNGYRVTVLEARPFAGGRATSYEVDQNTIDNCQHILLRCCHNLLDFYERLGVQDKIAFSREFTFIEPGGRRSLLRAGMLPAPAHFAGSFLKLRFLTLAEKIALVRGIQAIQSEAGRKDLDQITMQEWLEGQGQPKRVIERFWRQVLVSAINEELDRMAAAHGFQVFRLGFLAAKTAYEMGVPAVPLGELYGPEAWVRMATVDLRLRTQVTGLAMDAGRAKAVKTGGEAIEADYFVSAVPFERAEALLPELDLDVTAFEHSPITGIHLWFDRSVTELPHATLLDRTIQWMFNKGGGRYLQLVVSASRSLEKMPRGEVIELALRELAEFFPSVASAKLEKAHVVKEVRATFSAKPGLEAHRPVNETKIPNLFLAGDWTRSGWPATMEGAVRSGYLAAEAVTRAAGASKQFVIPDR